MAYLRAVYDGQSYMGNGGNGSLALKGDIWNAVSTWQSGSDTGPDSYTQEVQGYLASQAWRRSYPLHSAMPAGVSPESRENPVNAHAYPRPDTGGAPERSRPSPGGDCEPGRAIPRQISPEC